MSKEYILTGRDVESSYLWHDVGVSGQMFCIFSFLTLALDSVIISSTAAVAGTSNGGSASSKRSCLTSSCGGGIGGTGSMGESGGFVA